MSTRIRRSVSSALSLLAFTTAVVTAGDAKVSKKTIRAADGLNLVCEVRGNGDTALVFLHGWCGDHAYWTKQADAFAGEYRIVTLD